MAVHDNPAIAGAISTSTSVEIGQQDPDYLKDSEDESLPESPTADDGAIDAFREANVAALNDYVLAKSNDDNSTDHSVSIGNVKEQESDRIIDQAREYQEELFERAKDENVIAVLDTGSGKTLIAALLIRHFLQQELIDRSQGKPPKTIFFLVNSVPLANQQARFLNANLPQKVIALYGDSKVDLWRRAEWNRICAENNVVVCTAPVLDQCLMHGYLNMGQISLIVFDEAHHCKKNHPYSRIIRDYYLKWQDNRPRIFGMTASPVDESRKDIKQVVADLESMLQSKIITTNDLSVFGFAPRPADEYWIYPPPLVGEYETALHAQLHPLCGFIEDLKQHFSFSKQASRDLGAWVADRVWKYALPTSEHGITAIISKLERSSTYIHAIDDAGREAALKSVREAISVIENHDFGAPCLEKDNELSPKVAYLRQRLKERYSSFPNTRAIVFVEQRLTAFALCDLFRVLDLPNVRPGLLVGISQKGIDSSSWKDQEVALEKFRVGTINLIFATSVAEEGIDIPQCNLVVRFDLYKTPIQYMQSRGRARMKGSVYAHMMEEGKQSHQSEVDYAISQDDYIRRYCQELPPDRLLGRGTRLRQIIARDMSCQSFKTSAGVVANYSNSLMLLNRYAESLARIGAVSAEVYEELIDVEENMFRYKVILPPTDDERAAAVKGARGDARMNKVLAKRSAAFWCLVKLRRAHLLDENLDSIFSKVKPHNLNAREAVSDKKDIYEKKLKPDFWVNSGVGSPDLPTELFITHVRLEPRTPDWTTAGILLLTRSPLPELPSFPVYVDDNVEKHVILERLDRPVVVSPEQIEALTRFTLCGVFEDVFNKSFAPESQSMSYWLAPPGEQSGKWTFEDVINVPELHVGGSGERQRWQPAATPDTTIDNARKWCNAFLVDPGSGKFHYFTRDIVPATTIWDAIPDSAKDVQKKHKDTIIEFTDSTWRKKGKDLGSLAHKYDPHQPVLQAKLVMAGRNFLEKCPKEEQRYAMCEIAPQPLEIARVSYSVAQICQLWPSILHRLEAYLIVGEAFDKLDLRQIPYNLALEAFTKDINADDEMGEMGIHSELDGTAEPTSSVNYERLEFIGDSLLKMMTTITVFNRTTCNEEGMHCKRMEMISNKRLCSVASSPEYELYRYIRAGTGDRWRDTWYPEFLRQLKKGRVIKLTDKHRTHALGKKTIADVCEATIGACIMTTQDLPTSTRFDLGIKAITKLVGHEDHAITSWREILPMYKAPRWSLAMNDPVANDLARKVYHVTGYRFKNPCLLRSAFTHSSDQNSPVPDLQRLEFLGDACLDWVCIWWLFRNNPTRGPQWLTEHKMAMVSNRFLAALAVILGFNRLISASSPALYAEIGTYAAKVLELYEQEDVKPDFWTRVTSGSAPPKALADLVESYLGAVLVDSGFDFAEIEKFFDTHVEWFFRDIEAYDTFANRHPTTHLFRLLTEEFRCRKSRPEVIVQPVEPTTANTAKGGARNDAVGDEDDGAGDEAVTGIVIHVAWFVHGRMVAVSHGQGAKYAKVRASKAALKILGKLKVDEFRKQWGCDCAQSQAKDGRDSTGGNGKVNGNVDGTATATGTVTATAHVGTNGIANPGTNDSYVSPNGIANHDAHTNANGQQKANLPMMNGHGHADG
ncbi:Dicer-like protein 1 [Exophiala dermatitidis]|uniref:Dicer-like protein 1 n=2 Tax=Exophiala dermatitidis TaxID=5970 RepID=H6BRT5_EXODN|nr:RNA helicase/RNAse III [Exophiala dermatitidis NIH/UT8656]KAJ4515616.1 Dicer-like protein 1 [Exophiala dermatitidis]EHY54037.1 RNA helicase/RNAse III [Exophiala dermatitidis NIH/UT8656]KAJ4519294.1 Dicer-like protein 1 [Exophiala dermatitidis]KAJ4529110.1 Dicer-like protein 1 [Exophiala dermatitidis]KAJ4538510.1 Dicer-like protein 1 [Exophiala dermatitidis]